MGDAIAYLEKNPLPDVVLVTPNEKHASPTAAKALLDKLRQQREVDIGKLDIEWLERLYAVIDIARDLVTLIGLLLFIAVVLIIGNTIRLNILNKYDEIVVMKLVGATDAFIHRPVFIYRLLVWPIGRTNGVVLPLLSYYGGWIAASLRLPLCIRRISTLPD